MPRKSVPPSWRPDVQRARDLERRYGISPEEYARLLDLQGGVCAICGNPETLVRRGRSVPLMVDHDHMSGLIRGLLCHRCNVGLGLLEAVLRQALEYLSTTPRNSCATCVATVAGMACATDWEAPYRVSPVGVAAAVAHPIHPPGSDR